MPFFCIHCRSEIDPKYKACPFCGEQITDFLRRYLETPIDGKYQILARLGVGGMGEVYKVLHIHLNSIRVIKLMRANIAADPSAHERFIREARLATRIHHPNVAALFDFSTLDDESRYMVWEYIEGINLHELLTERGPLSPKYAARIAAQALHGLDAIHRAGIVHRDVSPENLMVTRDDEGEEQVKIIDLGIAKQWGDDGDNKTKTGMFVGKWKYCSPEHLGMLGEGERIDGRADIYSFGIVLYEMLTGVPPFQAETPHGYLMSHSSEKPKALRAVNPSVTASAELEALIFRALEKDRKKRFATAREFAQALEKIIPSLDDRGGVSAAIPATSAEVTAEPTRAAVRQADLATVVSTQQKRPTQVDPDAPTMETKATPDVLAAIRSTPPTLMDDEAPPEARGTAEPEPRPRSRRLPLIAAAAVAAIVVIVIGLRMLKKNDPPPPPAISQAQVVVQGPAHLGLNAYPWAEVTSIRKVATGEPVKMDQKLVTPAVIDLEPGQYEVTLANPSFRQPIRKLVDLGAGESETLNVPFSDPERATLPTFGASR